MMRRSEQTWAKWQNLVAEQAKSGQSVAAFCREHGLPAPHFFFWKKRLREAAGPQFVEVQVAKHNLQQRPSPAAVASSIEVRLSNGRSLVVAPAFDASHLRALLAVVESES